MSRSRNLDVELLGRGWSFPVLPERETRALRYAEGARKVRQAMELILDTEPGERLMRPGFGCGLRRHLMKPNTPTTRAEIQRDVESALRTWEPRVALREVRVEPSDDPALIYVRVAYEHVHDRSPGNLVYPFYLE